MHFLNSWYWLVTFLTRFLFFFLPLVAFLIGIQFSSKLLWGHLLDYGNVEAMVWTSFLDIIKIWITLWCMIFTLYLHRHTLSNKRAYHQIFLHFFPAAPYLRHSPHLTIFQVFTRNIKNPIKLIITLIKTLYLYACGVSFHNGEWKKLFLAVFSYFQPG